MYSRFDDEGNTTDEELYSVNAPIEEDDEDDLFDLFGIDYEEEDYYDFPETDWDDPWFYPQDGDYL